MDESTKICQYMENVFKRYEEFVQSSYGLPEHVSDGRHHFWDIVVISTFDEAQKEIFQKQIDVKKSNRSIPKVEFLVIPDPPGQKLGSGGSTLHVLQELVKQEGSMAYKLKILLIHSGGMSMRLPNYSMQGKLFSPVPVQGLLQVTKIPLMLDLKLALYMPFVDVLGPGIFVTCADDIETYFLDTNELDFEGLKNNDFVCLAHPTVLEVASNHGVYVLPPEDKQRTLHKSAFCCQCIKVLQKPSLEVMKGSAAVLNIGGRELVYSDSCFWMSPHVCQSLLKWYVTVTPLCQELDAYGHILTCLGMEGPILGAENLPSVFSDVYPILRKCKLSIIGLKLSRFYHLGTMEEYLENMTSNKAFHKELSLVSFIPSESSACVEKVDEFHVCVIASIFEEAAKIKGDSSTRAIVEWSRISIPCLISSGTIISNCNIQKYAPGSTTDQVVTLFPGFLYYTVPIENESQSLYVTIALETSCNIKAVHVDPDNLTYASCTLHEIATLLQCPVSTLLTEGELLSVWTLKLFAPRDSAAQSFWETYHLIELLLYKKRTLSSSSMQEEYLSKPKLPRLSIQSVMQTKDLNVFLRDREALIRNIEV